MPTTRSTLRSAARLLGSERGSTLPSQFYEGNALQLLLLLHPADLIDSLPVPRHWADKSRLPLLSMFVFFLGFDEVSQFVVLETSTCLVGGTVMVSDLTLLKPLRVRGLVT